MPLPLPVLTALIAPVLAGDAVPRDLPGEVMPRRAWDFVALHLDVRIDVDAGTVDGTARHTIAPLGDPDGWMRVHAVGIEVRAVRVDGEAVDGWRIGTETVDVPLPAGQGERVVEIDYFARPQTGMHFRGAKGSGDAVREAWSQGEDEDNRHWFPGWDSPNDRFRYSADVTAPSDLLAVTNGALVGKVDAGGGWARWSYALDRTITNYHVAVVVGDYDVYEDPAADGVAGGAPFEYVVPDGMAEATARRSLGPARDQMAWYVEKLGPYPYPVYRQIFVQRFLYHAMENPTVTTVETRLQEADDVARDVYAEKVVAHELVHHWFGDLLTTYGWREMWLNEGFAAFWAARWLEHAHGDDEYAAEVREWMQGARWDPAPLSPQAWSKVEGRQYGSYYDRGGAALHALRVHLGDDVLDRAVRTWVAENEDALVESSALRRTFEDASGEHLGWFFDQYVHGGGVPTVTSEHSWAGGELVITLRPQGDVVYHAPVDVEVGTAAGTVVKTAWIGEGEARIVVPTEAPPLWVAVDPRCGVIADWRHVQTPEAWAAQLDSPSACARLEAIEQLGKARASDAVVDALAKVARTDARGPVQRAAAVKALGALREPAVSHVTDLISDAEPRVRYAAIEALGGQYVEDERRDVLLGVARRDGDLAARGRAITALADLDADAVLPVARAALRGPDGSPRSWVHRAAVGALGEHGVEKDLDVLIDEIVDGYGRVRVESASAAVRVFSRLDAADRDARRRELSRALEGLLDSADLVERSRGVDLLGEVGDDRAVARLESVASTSTIADLADSARASASRIRSRSAQPKEERAADEDAKAVDERLDAMEKRLERLEQWR